MKPINQCKINKPTHNQEKTTQNRAKNKQRIRALLIPKTRLRLELHRRISNHPTIRYLLQTRPEFQHIT